MYTLQFYPWFSLLSPVAATLVEGAVAIRRLPLCSFPLFPSVVELQWIQFPALWPTWEVPHIPH